MIILFIGHIKMIIEINTKPEYRNTKQIQMIKIIMYKTKAVFQEGYFNCGLLNIGAFELRIYFRVSVFVLRN